MTRVLRYFVWGVLLLGSLVLLDASARGYIVQGPSMEPTVRPGSMVIVERILYRLRQPQRGDVIAFHPPFGAGNVVFTCYMKRIIGVPGDVVEVRNSDVYLNGASIDTAWAHKVEHYDLPAQKVPNGQYFVLGDNRDNSYDSHYGWLVPAENIVGRAWILVWPPSNPGPVR